MELTTSAGIALQDAIAARYFLIYFLNLLEKWLFEKHLSLLCLASDTFPLTRSPAVGWGRRIFVFVCVCKPF